MATGSIKWFGKKGFGFIIDDEGQEVFFHIGNSPALRGKDSSLIAGAEVDFDRRPSSKKGKEGTFEAHNVRLREMLRPPQALTATEETQAPLTVSNFHNPYTFVPTPPRGHIAPDQFAGDYDPVMHGLTHASLQPELWTGHLPIKLTTVTPLLLPDVGDKERKAIEHQTDMLDYLPESSLRGMLRSAYEIVTNSRYAAFRNSDRLAYRMETNEAIKLIPAMIESGQGSGKLAARLYLGTSQPTAKEPHGPMYAAMLTLYGDSARQSVCECEYEPKTGDAVWAEIVLCQHEVYEQNRRTHQWAWRNDYKFWKVVKIWSRIPGALQPAATGGTPWFAQKPRILPGRRRTYYAPVSPEDRRIVEGHVLITNQNINNKHDERVFFGPESRTFDVTGLQDAWQRRIQNYREAHHEDDIFARPIPDSQKAAPWDKIGDTPGKTAWSPHIYQDGEHSDRWSRTAHDARCLRAGDLARIFHKKAQTSYKSLIE